MIALKIFLFRLLGAAAQVYMWTVLAYCVSTFFVRDRHARWFVFLSDLVTPPLNWIRKLTNGKTAVGNIDMSPMILMLGIYVLIRVLTLMSQ